MKLFRTFSGRGLLVAYLALAASLVFTACRSFDDPGFSSDAPSGSLSQNAGDSDVFAVGNIVTVTFSGVTDLLPPHEETIKEDGTITLPLIGAVKAAGKSAGELQKEIHDRYVPKYYNANLAVTVKSQMRVYYVGGQVKAPGRQEYIGTTTVTKAIQSAGDFTDFAKKTAVELTRAGSKKPIKVDCKKALKDPSKDLPVYPGDKIHVPQRIW
jgi:protein involved in polysaccharide export with SLBB domain